MYLNGKHISNYGLTVLNITGIFNMPARLPDIEHVWVDVAGVEPYVAAQNIYTKQNIISVKFLMRAGDMFRLQAQLQELLLDCNEYIIIETDYSTHTCILRAHTKVSIIHGKYGTDSVAEFTFKFSEVQQENGTPHPSNPLITDSVFWLDKVDLSSYGIVVEDTAGNFDFPAMQNDKITKYHSESLQVTPRGKRDIKLTCTLLAPTMGSALAQMRDFRAHLLQDGLRELMLPIAGVLTPYKVYSTHGLQVRDIIQNKEQVAVRFTLLLTEPKPEVQTYTLDCLTDTDDVQILTTDGDCIYVVRDFADTKPATVYLFTEDENIQRYLWTTEELDISDAAYNAAAKNIFIFTVLEL